MRAALISFGFLALIVAWLVLPNAAPMSFSLHMTMHMMVVAVAAPMLSLGIAGSQFDPVRKAPRPFAAIPISMAELVVVWAWHAPVLHHFARHTTTGLFLEQTMFLLFGLLLWLAAFGGDTPRDSQRAAAGVLGLLLTMMHMILLGVLLALSPRILYGMDHHGVLSPLADQHLGGAIMIFGGGLSYLLGGLWLTKDLIRTPAFERGNLP